MSVDVNTRSLAARLKRLEFRARPGFQPPQTEISIVDSKAQTLYKMRLGTPEDQFFTPDVRPISKEEADRLGAAWEMADENDRPTAPPA